MTDTPRARQISSDRISDALRNFEYRLMDNDENREEIYRLRYRAYLREGAIEPNAAEMVCDEFDIAPNTWIVGIYYKGDLVSSLRVTVSTPDHPDSPSLHVFEDLLMPHVKAGKVIVDPTKFVVEPDLQRRIALLPYMSVRAACMAIEHFNADIGLATVRDEHVGFYQRALLHKPASKPRLYTGLLKPVQLMVSPGIADREKVLERYPIFASTLGERLALFEARYIHQNVPEFA